MTERNDLFTAGWKYEGIGWYSNDNKEIALYHEYNPNATTGNHNYTTSTSEDASLVKAGRKAEGNAWHGLSDGATAQNTNIAPAPSAINAPVVAP